MKKDTQFTLRIPSALKARLKEIAATEGRSVAQICESLLRAGFENYKKKGFGFLRRYQSSYKNESAE